MVLIRDSAMQCRVRRGVANQGAAVLRRAGGELSRVRQCKSGYGDAEQGAAVLSRVRRGKAGYDVERRVRRC